MLVNIGVTAAMHGARLHKTSRREAMVRDPRRETYTTGQERRFAPRPRGDRDVEDFVQDEIETETLVRLETVSRPRRLDHIPVHYLVKCQTYRTQASDNTDVLRDQRWSILTCGPQTARR